MKRGLSRTAIATGLAASLVLHASAFALFSTWESDEEEAMTEGGPGIELAMVGDPFDALAAGEETANDMSDVAEPVTASQTVEAQPAETVTAEQVETVEAVDPSETPSETTPEETSETAEPTEVAAVRPETVETAAVTETVEAMDPQPENVPQPTQRPTPPPRPEPQRTRTAERAEPKQAENRQSRRGNRGSSQANARRGSQEAGRSARSGSRGTGVSAAQAQSNYSGQVLSAIRRAQRYPSAARRNRAQGTATVSFTVTAGGGKSSIRVVRSSGDRLLDRAAADTVRRAGIPPIPREAGRRSMSFSVPIRFQLR